jgi:hypothetical protein
MSILSSNYLAVGTALSTTSNSKYVPVDPTAYQGTWKGQYGTGKAFSVSISGVSGFKATVKYQSGSTINYSQVLIKDSAFRIGDTKFVLQGSGTAQVSTAVTDPLTGSVSLQQAYAKLS